MGIIDTLAKCFSKPDSPVVSNNSLVNVEASDAVTGEVIPPASHVRVTITNENGDRQTITPEEYNKLRADEIQQRAEKHHDKINSINFDTLPQSPVYDGPFSDDELAFLSVADGLSISAPKFARKWSDESDLDYNDLLHKLWGAGLIGYPDAATRLSKCILPALKEFLAQQGDTFKGKKSEIIEHILCNCSNDLLLASFPPQRIVLTEKGLRVQKKYQNHKREQDWKAASAAHYEAMKKGDYSGMYSALYQECNVIKQEGKLHPLLGRLLLMYYYELAPVESLERAQQFFSAAIRKSPDLSIYVMTPLIPPALRMDIRKTKSALFGEDEAAFKDFFIYMLKYRSGAMHPLSLDESYDYLCWMIRDDVDPYTKNDPLARYWKRYLDDPIGIEKRNKELDKKYAPPAQ